jgi:hypothetical protein
MKTSAKKVVALGCGLPIVLIILSFLLLFYETHKKLEYRGTGYRKDYSWNGIEVGTVIRFPVNTSIPIGRYCAVIAFKNSQMTDAHILFRGPLGEVPERPEFVSGKEQTVIYRTKSKGEVTLDLSRWMTYLDTTTIVARASRPCRAASPNSNGRDARATVSGLVSVAVSSCARFPVSPRIEVDNREAFCFTESRNGERQGSSVIERAIRGARVIKPDKENGERCRVERRRDMITRSVTLAIPGPPLQRSP